MTSLGAPQKEMHQPTLDTPQKEIRELPLDTSQQKISNPIIPYVGTIHGGLVPGELIVIHGAVPDDADRFQVDLQCGSSIKPRADVAFHFNPRFRRSGCVVCNTLEREKWGWEEITYEMPFEKGESFEIVIMILKDKFQVTVNKKHLLLYKHRISLEKIDTLGIYGKVKIKTIEFVSKSLQGSQPSSLGVTKISTENGEMLNDSQLGVPYVGKLDTALRPGCTIAIKGEVNKKAKSFAINLKPSGSKDIALHLNPRMKNKVFVRNSYLHDSWGEEEKEVASFPFSPGMYFELIIFCDAYQFKVAINGVHTLEYKHRFKQLEKINMVEVTGDVHLLDYLQVGKVTLTGEPFPHQGISDPQSSKPEQVLGLGCGHAGVAFRTVHTPWLQDKLIGAQELMTEKNRFSALQCIGPVRTMLGARQPLHWDSNCKSHAQWNSVSLACCHSGFVHSLCRFPLLRKEQLRKSHKKSPQSIQK